MLLTFKNIFTCRYNFKNFKCVVLNILYRKSFYREPPAYESPQIELLNMMPITRKAIDKIPKNTLSKRCERQSIDFHKLMRQLAAATITIINFNIIVPLFNCLIDLLLGNSVSYITIQAFTYITKAANTFEIMLAAICYIIHRLLPIYV